MLDAILEYAPNVAFVLVFADMMLFLTGNKSVLGWILDKIGW